MLLYVPGPEQGAPEAEQDEPARDAIASFAARLADEPQELSRD